LNQADFFLKKRFSPRFNLMASKFCGQRET
jgi:hypothetical protein